MKHPVNRLVIVCGYLAWVLAATGAELPTGTGDKSPALETRGLALGGQTAMVCVARDEAAWVAVKQAAGRQQMLPLGIPTGDDLRRLDGIDFRKQMIVAIFWGRMSFAGQDENCRIDHVGAGHQEIVVDCQVTLWGGATDHAYRAWPYHARVVARSDLPVRFKQTTEWRGDPSRGVQNKTLAILKPGEWKRGIATGE